MNIRTRTPAAQSFLLPAPKTLDEIDQTSAFESNGVFCLSESDDRGKMNFKR